jgi:hypothetical protein
MVPSGAPDGTTPVFFAPAHPAVFEGQQEPAFEVRPGPDGTSELPVFSSPERLAQTLGRYQPWVALPLAELRRAATAAGVDRLVLDPRASPDAWRWSRRDLEELPGKLTAANEGAGHAENQPAPRRRPL